MTTDVSFSCRDTSIATVDSSGLVGCLAPGATYLDAFTSLKREICNSLCAVTAVVAVAATNGPVNVKAPSLSGPDSVTRTGSATFTIQNTISTSGVANWRFSAGSETVTGCRSGCATSWSGMMVAGGTVSVTVVQGGSTFNLSKSITVNPRSGWAFTAVPATKVPNGFNSVLTVANPPSSSNTVVGKFQLFQDFHVFFERATDGGPNDGFNYVTSINGGTTAPTAFRWVITEELDNQGTFFQMQCGSYNPQTNSGFISGADLRSNTIWHESNGTKNSHYFNYKTAQDNPANNVGLVAEMQVAGPSVTLSTFKTDVINLLKSKEDAITSATQVEPCFGLVTNDHGGNCEFLGFINYSPYQTCP